MPIYEYECAHCGHFLSSLQKMSDPLLTECPECKQPTLNKLLVKGSFQLKGDGWFGKYNKENK